MFNQSKKPLAMLLAMLLLCACPLAAFAQEGGFMGISPTAVIIFDGIGVMIDGQTATNGDSGTTNDNGTWSMENGTITVSDEENSVSGDGGSNSVLLTDTNANLTMDNGSSLLGISAGNDLTLNIDGAAAVGNGGVTTTGDLGIVGKNAGGGDNLKITSGEGHAIKAGGTLTVDNVTVTAHDGDGPAVSADKIIIREGGTLNGQGYEVYPVDPLKPIKPDVTETERDSIDNIADSGEPDATVNGRDPKSEPTNSGKANPSLIVTLDKTILAVGETLTLTFRVKGTSFPPSFLTLFFYDDYGIDVGLGPGFYVSPLLRKELIAINWQWDVAAQEWVGIARIVFSAAHQHLLINTILLVDANNFRTEFHSYVVVT